MLTDPRLVVISPYFKRSMIHTHCTYIRKHTNPTISHTKLQMGRYQALITVTITIDSSSQAVNTWFAENELVRLHVYKKIGLVAYSEVMYSK